jgi:hypothetical protein
MGDVGAHAGVTWAVSVGIFVALLVVAVMLSIMAAR